MKRLSRRVLAVGLIAPVAITVIATVVGLTWLGDLPGTIATHWNGAGEADGYGTPLGLLLQLAATSIVLAALFTGIAATGTDGRLGNQQKLLLVLSLFVAVLVATIGVVLLGLQRGLADGQAAPNPIGALVPGLVLGVAAAVIGWFILPKARRAGDSDATTPEPLPLTKTERVLWTRSVKAPLPLAGIVVAVAVLIVVSAIVAPSTSPWPWVFTIFVVLVLLGTLAWQVRVDKRGVVVRSLAGLPRFSIRLADVASASVPGVNALAEFGGWGIRFGTGRRLGVILNGGEALEVHRKEGRSLVVTVPDALGAASVINGLIARENSAQVPPS